MKTQKLEQLRRCNNLLKEQSWTNYQQFLGVMLRSTTHPKASELLGFLLSGDFDGLLECADSISSATYGTASEHYLLNQLSAVIRKYPYPDKVLVSDPREAATNTFRAAEHKCSRVNRRFSCYSNLRSPHEQSLSVARSWIDYTLGPIRPSFVYDLCDFGPGASIGIHGSVTNSARKLLSREWSVSPSAFHYAYASMGRDAHIWELLTEQPGTPYFSYDIDLYRSRFNEKASMVNNNKITFVPKTARTERTIAIEPLLNGYLQKGIDLFMRKRLKRIGIDLSDQTRNQELARLGSLPDENDPYVTIDLSSASDSVSIELCRYMLPPDWFDFLNSVRSKSYELNGRFYTYHKFASMGNGFCFPLETLLFASLCHVACVESKLKDDFTVYGDDIIVRSSVAPRVLSLLKICGFRVNTSKTFLSGPFRESCGADWFEGKDVRPLSLDYAFDSLENVFKFCNLARSKEAWKSLLGESLDFLETLIPPSLKFTRPQKGNVDTALEVPLDVFVTSPFARWKKSTFSWSWLELQKSAWPDIQVKRFAGYNVALIRGALNGSKSPVPFAERHKTCTKIKRVSPSSGWSLYLPGTLVRLGDRPQDRPFLSRG